MPFEMLHLTANDATEFAALDAAAMEHWAVAQAMDKEAQRKGNSRQSMIESWMKIGLSKPDPNSIWLKVQDSDTGEIIAGANWTMQLEPEEEKPKNDVPAPAEVEVVQPKEDPPSILGEMRERWKVTKDKFIGIQPHITLRVLVTHPKHQRKGAGGMLVRWGCEKADEAGVIAVLQASEAGLALYLNNGFQIVDEDKFDLRPFGVDATDLRRCMIRQPKQQA